MARPMIRFQLHPAGPRSRAGRSQRTVQHNPLSAMAITRYNRGSEFDLLRREMSRFFDDFFLPSREGEEGQRSAVWAPRADLSETDDAYLIALDLPGLRRDEIEITMEDGTLKVSGERSMETESENGQYHRIERSYGRFFRSFSFGPNADADNVEASFDDG